MYEELTQRMRLMMAQKLSALSASA